MAPQEKQEKTEAQKQDEVINVTLSRTDYDVLRGLITAQKSLSWMGRFARNVLFVAAAGILTLFAFGNQLKQVLSSWLGGN